MTLSIVGYGKMAFALAKGLMHQYELEIIGRNKEKLQDFVKELNSPKLVKTYTFENFNAENKTILFCVKPYALEKVAPAFKQEAACIYSILAGTTIKSLQTHLHAKAFVRCMPNLGAEFLDSTTTLTGEVSKKDEALAIFEQIGDAIWLESEKELDIATAIAGSGPAYLALIAEALADGGVNCGLKRTDAIAITNSLFASMPKVLKNYHSAILKDNVMSPNGTTARGYEALEEGNVRNSFIKAVKAAFLRTQE